MNTITLQNGVEMPLVGLGTWNLRGKECAKTVSVAIDLGYRLIDTAQMYENEKEVGEGIKKSNISREEIFITTKIFRKSNGYEKAKKAIEESLQNLGVDYIDLLLLHEPYSEGLEMYRALEEAYKEGYVRAIGISNYDERWYQKFMNQCEIIPTVNQLEAHVYFQKWKFQEEMKKQGTILQAWAPLAQGINQISMHPTLKSIGQRYGKSAAQVALRSLVQRGISVIPKSKQEARLKENIDIFDFSLSDEEVKEIRLLDKDDTLFPWTKMF